MKYICKASRIQRSWYLNNPLGELSAADQESHMSNTVSLGAECSVYRKMQAKDLIAFRRFARHVGVRFPLIHSRRFPIISQIC